MPIINVTSLPFTHPIALDEVLEALCHDFARDTEIALQHITATWSLLTPGHYAVAGRAGYQQNSDAYPILVDLLTPDFITSDTIERMLVCVAESLAKHTPVSNENIFINHRLAHSGRIYDNGKIVHW